MNRTILVVEDDEALAAIWQEALEEAGYGVVVVTDGEDALACLPDAQPDMIICDLGLPHLRGEDVCLTLRAAPGFEKTPIIVATAAATIPRSILDDTTIKVLRKPFGVDTALDVIDGVFAQPD